MGEIWIMVEHWAIALFMVGVIVLLSFTVRKTADALDGRVQKVYFWLIGALSLVALAYILTFVFHGPFF